MPSASKAPYRTALTAALIVAVVAVTGCESQGSSSSTAPAKLTTAQDSTLYALGLGLAGQFNLRGLFTAAELETMGQGLRDGVLGQERLDLGGYLQQMNQIVETRRSERSAALQNAASDFVVAAAAEAGAVQTESGLVYIEQQAGTGRTPTATDSVTVHYTGTFTDGSVFDSSVRRGEPITFLLSGVIPGWQEGLQMMQEGGKARLVIPPQLGYGEQGSRSIPGNVALVFEVELIEVR